jgi:hypothetical protein
VEICVLVHISFVHGDLVREDERDHAVAILEAEGRGEGVDVEAWNRTGGKGQNGAQGRGKSGTARGDAR